MLLILLSSEQLVIPYGLLTIASFCHYLLCLVYASIIGRHLCRQRISTVSRSPDATH